MLQRKWFGNWIAINNDGWDTCKRWSAIQNKTLLKASTVWERRTSLHEQIVMAWEGHLWGTKTHSKQSAWVDMDSVALVSFLNRVLFQDNWRDKKVQSSTEESVAHCNCYASACECYRTAEVFHHYFQIKKRALTVRVKDHKSIICHAWERKTDGSLEA